MSKFQEWSAWIGLNRLVIGVVCLAASTNGPVHAAAARYSVLATFPSHKGGLTSPEQIILGRDGNLYGVASSGGTSGNGGLFSITPDGIIRDLHEYRDDEGRLYSPSQPYVNRVGLVQAADGTLVGVSNGGGDYADAPGGSPAGVAFSWSTAHSFSLLRTLYPVLGDIASPIALAGSSDGGLYGLSSGSTWQAGMWTSTGNLFRLSQAGTFTNLYAFHSYTPTNFLLRASGDMVVTLPLGTELPTTGTRSTGDVIFSVTPEGAGTPLYVLNPATEGRAIVAFTQDSAGNLFGAAQSGGPGGNGDGTIFRLGFSGDFSVMHSFSTYAQSAWQGALPSSLVAATDGSVYGTTWTGGAKFNGVVFRITPSGAYSVLHAIGDIATDGARPRLLVQAAPRTFYGIAGAYGVQGSPTQSLGLVFKLVVPVQDDTSGKGKSSLVASGANALTIGAMEAPLRTTTVAEGYYPAAVADMDGDGIADIIWTSARHDLYVWLGGPAGFTPLYIGTYPEGWRVAGSGDINGDGKDDLIWMNDQAHQFAYWLMDGAERTGYAIIDIAPGYYPAAVGDFNGDGLADILWTSVNHDLYLWQSTGKGFTAKYMTTFPAGWKIAGRGDLDGDGKVDIIWESGDGSSWGYWLMDGAAIRSVVPLPHPASLLGFHIGATGDYDGDGLADIVWVNGASTVLWNNLGVCTEARGCEFTASGTASLPVGQHLFNSGIPASMP